MNSKPSVLGALGGAVGGLGVALLLQQFAVAYPTPMLVLLCVLGGIVVNVAVVGLAGALRSSAGPTTAVMAPAAGEPSPSVSAHEPPSTTWVPTSMVTATAPAYPEPDPALVPVTSLEAGTPVRLLERRGGWAHVQSENGFVAWIDGRFAEDPGPH